MKNKKTINRVLQLIRPYTYLVVSILVLAAVTVAATLYSPILIGKGVDCMIEKGPVSFPDLKLVLLQLAVVTAISAISQWVMSLLTNKMTYKIDHPYYEPAAMGKYLASIMDTLNHDVSVEKVRSTTSKITKLLAKNREEKK